MPADLLLDIQNLSVTFDSDRRKLPAVQGVDLQIHTGEVLGLVGESGCGKSVMSLSVMALLDKEFAHISGNIRFEGRELLGLTEKEMNRLRGNRMSMIFQEPMTSLNPVFTVQQQIGEVLALHQNLSQEKCRAACLDMLRKVGMPDAEHVAASYPHRLSGGQRQRVMIAMALCCEPALLVADEPTTALDVTIQAQVLSLLKTLQQELQTAILFISHDLGVIAEVADRIAVMYAGRIVEQGTVQEIFANPQHPYTLGLMASRTFVDEAPGEGDSRKLPCIPGNVPSPDMLPEGCSFWPRCAYCTEQCKTAMPPLAPTGPGHLVRCFRDAGARQTAQEGGAVDA